MVLLQDLSFHELYKESFGGTLLFIMCQNLDDKYASKSNVCDTFSSTSNISKCLELYKYSLDWNKVSDMYT